MPDYSLKNAYTADVADSVTAGANDLKHTASHALDDASDRVERAGHSVSARVASVADRAASAFGSTSEYVREIDSGNIMENLTSLAKRHPAATLAAAVAIGFLVGRSATRS